MILRNIRINRTVARTRYRKGLDVYANLEPMKAFVFESGYGWKHDPIRSGHAFSCENDRIRRKLNVDKVTYSYIDDGS